MVKRNKNFSKFFPQETSFNRIYRIFKELKLHKKGNKFFLENSSSIIEKIRRKSFQDLLKEEDLAWITFFQHYFKKIEVYDTKIQELIIDFFKKCREDIYNFNLSVTQRRRARAGSEFENIIELIFHSSGIPIERQGVVLKMALEKKLI